MNFYSECIHAFNAHQVKFLVLGGFAVNFYGFNRYTADLDVWVDSSEENLKNLNDAILKLGFESSENLTAFLTKKSILLRLGDDYHKVDILQKINLKKSFDACYQEGAASETAFGKVVFIGYQDLINEKTLSRRPKDLLDIKELTLIRDE